MWKENESAVHQSQTFFQKLEGVLYVTNFNVCWVANGSPKPSIMIPLSQITSQQVSTQDASRVKLRLLVRSENSSDLSYTFLWKEKDKDFAKTDRDAFKNALAILMSKTRTALTPSNPITPGSSPEQLSKKQKLEQNHHDQQKASGLQNSVNESISSVSPEELKIRILILSKNPELSHLHKTLVVPGIISEDSFWLSRKHLIDEYTFENHINKGEDSSLLELAPSILDNGNFKYTITPEIAKMIFKTFPYIKQAYVENVPNIISESSFWKRLLASQLFTNASSKIIKVSKDPLFDKYLDEDKCNFIYYIF
ncbi:hypothetical protein BB560_004160 [Smittium megazygosporum]|uniref:BSD domain-containing protein n=1 Tax=Smittium megazygosporum TaxID=133381 RepID=A0A2T9ZA28_9FUNG|nr:hypothetical protein BB560_004160 [Smittium megazygosporum]